MNIKICGMRDAANIKAVADLKPDYIGFIFYGQSPRYVGADFEIPELDKGIKKIGVFVNEAVNTVLNTAKKYQLDGVQLHGTEDAEYCRIIRSNRLAIIKAIPVSGPLPINRLISYTGCIDYFLFDTATPHFGGSGQSFDWALLDQYNLEIPFFISGGIGTEHAAQVFDIDHPQCSGVDANSRLEAEPGIKQLDLTEQFIKTIRNGKI
ncbi:MAG: hypothetical protein BGO31_01800 [Bacteroidetes bacterium 43-16]|nr:MAG: hypothetical protein BGO31_01800 [Bacteroidetes bacterium 43-16]